MKNFEYISAMVDEEVADGSSAVDGVLGDAEARGAWQRYHLVRDVIQNDYNPALPTNFAELVREEIAFEAPLSNVVSLQAARPRAANPEHADPRRANARLGIWKPVAGLAVAASLIGGTLLSTQLRDSGAPQTRPTPVVENPEPPKTSSVTMVAELAPGTRWQMEGEVSEDNSERIARLNSLLTNHLEVASMGKVQGMVLHSRVVGYDGMQRDGESN